MAMGKSILLPLLAQIFLHSSMAGARMAAPLRALEQGHSALAVGVMLALFSAASAFLSLPAGRLLDRLGLHRPLTLGVLMGASGAAVAALTPAYWALCVAALLSGAGTNVGMLAVQRYAARITDDPPELRKLYSWLSVGPTISNFGGPVFTGLLIDAAGYRAAFSVLAVLPLAGLALVARVPRVQMAALAHHAALARRSIVEVLRRPGVARVLSINGLVAISWDIHTFVVPILGHDRMLSASLIGAVLGSFAVAATVVRVAIPFLAERLEERVVLTAALLLNAAVFLAYPFTTTALAMGVCSSLLGVALGAVQPMTLAALHQLTPPARYGEILGARMGLLNLTSTVSPLVFGGAGAALGVNVIFWATAAAVLAGSRIAMGVRIPHPRSVSTDEGEPPHDDREV